MGGRLGRFLALVPRWLTTAWWGLVSSRVGERPLVVDGVVLRPGPGGREVLLVVRPDVRGWELPGGHADPGESPEAALAREIREEAGVGVTVGERTGVYRRTGFLPHTACVHLCQVAAGVVRPSPESPTVAWWPERELPSTLLPWVRTPLADALAHVPGAAPVERADRNDLARILEAARIDLRMRASGDRAR